MDNIGNRFALNDRLYPGFIAFFLRQHKAAGQGHGTATGRVGTWHGPGPYPGNNRGLSATLFSWQLHTGVEMPYAPEGFFLYPAAVIVHIISKTGCARPGPAGSQSFLCLRVYRRLAGKSGWYFDHGLVDHHGHGIEIMGMGFKAEPLCLKRESSAACKGIKKDKRIVSHVLSDFCPGFFQYFFISGVFPLHQLCEQVVQPFALLVLLLLCWKEFRMGRGIVHQGSPENSTGCSQGTACPPEMQR